MTIRVVLVDDHPIVLDGLERLFARHADLQVVGQCADGVAALAVIRAQRPHVAVLDLRLPGKDGLSVIREVTSERGATRFLVLTAALEERQLVEILRLGAGVMLKDAAPESLIEAVHRVHRGEQCIDPALLGSALERLIGHEDGAPTADLTAREVEVIRMVAAGLQNKEIAARLGIHTGTVKIHLHHIYEKLEVSSRVQLTLLAQARGLV
jgi:DNA-binding NarL/FixJ family response regulator